MLPSPSPSPAPAAAEGEGSAAPDAAPAATSAEEVKRPEINLEPGAYTFVGEFTKGSDKSAMNVQIQAEAGGVVTSAEGAQIKYNGFVTNGKVTLKAMFDDGKETEFDGYFETEKQIVGSYKSDKLDQYDATGTFKLDRQ